MDNSLIGNYVPQTVFSSYEDFMEHFTVNVPNDFNFGYDIVDVYAEKQPNKEAIIWTNDRGEVRHLNYREYKRYSDMMASYFLQLGIRRGDCVMLILKRRLEWWIVMVALHKIGAVAVPATHLLTDKDIIYRCHEAQIRMIISVGDKVVLRNIIRARSYCPSLRHCVSIGPMVPQRFENLWQGAMLAPKFRSQKGENKATDNFIMYFTSGTSSEPKMVMHNYAYPLAHILTARYWHNVHSNSLHLTVADTGWAKATWGKFYGQMIAGATIFVYDFDGKFQPKAMLTAMQEFKVTSFCAPPTVYRFMIQEDISQYDLSHLEYCTTAGEALNPSVFDEWQKKTGLMIHESYGQTESTLILGTYPFVSPRPGSMGRPNPQYDVMVIDNDGKPCQVGEHGNLVIRVDKKYPLGLFKEYYQHPEKTEQAFANGVYYTNDIVYYDEEGYFWFVSRADDVIKSSGYRIGPFEVESALMCHPAVLECAITGVPDPIRGMVVKATIVLVDEYKEADKAALMQELKEHVKRETAPYKYPRVIEFVDELPKTISGKIRRVEIRQKDSEE